ncbi:MAG: hypothetical protein DRN15_09440 [Thermoprotei archaeon]|nr:MAG: hypothetical protein DRN15_09440 [Thermoprotei archaeon]
MEEENIGIDIKSFEDGGGFLLLAVKYEGKWCTFLLTFKDLDGFVEFGKISEKLVEYLEGKERG